MSYFLVGHPLVAYREERPDGIGLSKSVKVAAFIEACQKAIEFAREFGEIEHIWLQERGDAGAIAEYDVIEVEDDDGSIFYAFVPLVVNKEYKVVPLQKIG